MEKYQAQKLGQVTWNEELADDLGRVCEKWYRTGRSCEELASSLVWRACVEAGLEEVEDIVALVRAVLDADGEPDEDGLDDPEVLETAGGDA